MTKAQALLFKFAPTVCMGSMLCMATAVASSAQVTLTTLVNFNGTNGNAPDAVLTQGADGNFYGTTGSGGASESCDFGCGTVFKVTAGALTTLYSFCAETGCMDGAGPVGPLIQAANGDFYGTTSTLGAYGGGTVFKITPAGTLTTLYSFCALADCADGYRPNGGLVQGRNGNFYGTTIDGGITSCFDFNVGCGTIFEITPTGTLTTLYSFCASNADCPDGDFPSSGLLQASNGQFYGETGEGGAMGYGTIFEVTPNGKLTTLTSFNGNDGLGPSGGLIQTANGNFYGVAEGGGTGEACDRSDGCGTVFEVTSAGKLTALYNFCSLSDCGDGSFPNGPLVQGTDANLYGTTLLGGALNPRQGTLFEITIRGTLTTLYTFCSLTNCADGADPAAGLMQDTNGAFYGTTAGGGTGEDGTIFSLSTGLGPFVKTQPTSAKEGATIGIFGQGFTRSSVIEFGGVPATNIKLSGSTFLFATVPAGALTGPVTVTAGETTLTSNQEFRVTPQLLSFNPPSGPVGTQVTIMGTGFTQTSAVGFGDNSPAEFTVNSDTEVTATVPSGATTGPIGVVTKGGTVVSSAIFTLN
jgi:uncharacterized repeat protein (TIGR03803 family)